MEKPKYQKRKPDKETELLRMWILDKNSKESKEFEEKTKDSTEITYKDMKIKITGFTELRDKKTNKLKFAYKFKHDERFVVYYVPDNNKEGMKCLEIIKRLIPLGGYNLQNMEEQLKSIYAELGEKLKDDKNKKRKN